MDTLLTTRTLPTPTHLPEDENFAEIVAALRRPLPSHALEGGNFRRWAVAVCHAEVKHREADYARVERLLGITTDRWAFPNDCERGQFAHEAHASAALLWLSHLQTHESERRKAWDCLPWRMWKPARRAAWIAKRRVLWAGFLNAVRNYKAAKGEGR
tara:strand:+ start:593 stop:1063 length:471 start_codon:yes stop_codon:yes gene_type:complete